MFEYTSYNIAPWGPEIAVYFFLIGTAGMVFVLAAAPNIFGAVAHPLAAFQKMGAIISLVLLLVCTPLLIVDLGQPARFLYPILYFRWTSPLSWGALFLPLFGVCIVLFWIGLTTGRAHWLKPVGIIGSLLGLSMPLYTGLDLMVHQARDIWSNPTIPVLFVILSITSGTGLTSVILQLTRNLTPELTTIMRNILFFSVAVTLFLFLGVWLTLLYGSEEQIQALAIIYSEFPTRFWLLTFLIGILVPLVLVVALLAAPRLAYGATMVSVAGVAGAIGAYTFREVLLYAGQLTQIYY